jgi:hypothetical protein
MNGAEGGRGGAGGGGGCWNLVIVMETEEASNIPLPFISGGISPKMLFFYQCRKYAADVSLILEIYIYNQWPNRTLN